MARYGGKARPGPYRERSDLGRECGARSCTRKQTIFEKKKKKMGCSIRSRDEPVGIERRAGPGTHPHRAEGRCGWECGGGAVGGAHLPYGEWRKVEGGRAEGDESFPAARRGVDRALALGATWDGNAMPGCVHRGEEEAASSWAVDSSCWLEVQQVSFLERAARRDRSEV